ncbi:FAD-dependent oxidoreductase [Stakelama sp. CBK3Z-3]|uniref:FAD-dependent oxidoreductase n=1 Tax=Stakelama flava TaxID=2860338 RepID=A0ABS6XHT9_9SPHN|nr:FAD-dependent oxidoreductase [Stakelama flava]MBW4329778.1 FAD-dependent oxidoreductase [Stakelama flava]
MTDLPDLATGIPSDQLREDDPVAGDYHGTRVVLVRRGDAIFAMGGSCTHLGAPLETGMVIGDQLRCPWHHARFDLASGEAVGGPAIPSLGCFTTEEAEGTVRVTGRRDTKPRKAQLQADTPIVIIGTGAAGHALADKLARAGQGDAVTLITAEAAPPYERTMLSKQYLSGAQDRDSCFLPGPGEDGGARPQIRTGTKIVAIDREKRVVTSDTGEQIPYGTLVLATGAEPVLPDFGGKAGKSVFRLRSIEDADNLIAAAENAESAVVLGGSFVGLEVAASLRQRGLRVTVIDRNAIPMESVLGAEAGGLVRRVHENQGITFHLQRQIASYDGTSVTLDDGTMIAADMLVVGAGVAPRIDLAHEAGLTLAKDADGIHVDKHLTTSDPAIRAIGDIASYPHPRLGRPVRIEHWVHAQRQGEHLARLMLGETDQGFTDTPFFWSGHYDTKLRYVGHAGKPVKTREQGSIQSGDFAVFFADSSDGKGDQAMLSCGRDREAIEVEAEWSNDIARL